MPITSFIIISNLLKYAFLKSKLVRFEYKIQRYRDYCFTIFFYLRVAEGSCLLEKSLN